MIEMKIKSLRDQSLRTSCGSYWLVEGEVRLVTFKNMAEFEAYLGMGVFQPVASDTPESKSIPVVLPVPTDEEGLPLELHDGESALPLSNDPEELGEPSFVSMDLPEEYGDEPMEDGSEDLEDEDESEDREEDESWEADSDWTNEIDHV